MHNLESLAYKAERAASRRLAAREGHPLDEALRLTLEQVAGGATRLPALLESRLALQVAGQARMQARADRRCALLAAKTAARTGVTTLWQGWFDGSAWPNPGRCGIGALITGPAQQRIAISRAAGHGNSSEAEYRALIALLEAALAHGACPITIHGDSKVVIDDAAATARAPAAALAPLREQAQNLLKQLPGAVLRWIPRHRNGDADALSQQARGAHLNTDD